jgi:hypothetical protein
MPLGFELAKLIGPRYALRCLLFHDIADHVSEFTKGLGVTLGIKGFAALIKFISQHYTPLGLARDRSNSPGTDLYRLNRVNVHVGTDKEFFAEIEVLPRLRSLADTLLRRNQRS